MGQVRITIDPVSEMNRDDIVLELFQRAATDREHGAAEIEATLIRGLLELPVAFRPVSLYEGARLLAAGQPAMANLRKLAAAADDSETEDGFKTWLAWRFEVLTEIPERLAANAWPHIERSAAVVTLSRSSAVAAALEGAWERGWSGSAVVLDGTASGRGADQAQSLEASGRVISRPDADAPIWLEQVSVVVLVGADAVGVRRFVNAAGTRILLELARQREVVTVLVADTAKDVDDELVEEILRRSPVHSESPDREWPIFEAVPLDLVTTRVSEQS